MSTDPLHTSNLNPVQCLWWHLLEGYTPLGAKHIRNILTREYSIELGFYDKEEDLYMYVRIPEQGMFERIKSIILYWESLELDD